MLDVVKRQDAGSAVPFDADRLDRLMDEAGLDVLIATSKHNVQYLLGGHRAFFFDYMDAMGLSRYLPVFIYPKGAPDKAAYFGHRLESFQRENEPFWVSQAVTNSSGSVDTMQKAVDYLRTLGGGKRIGAELAFLPMDAGSVLWRGLGEIKDATFVLERMRAIKSPQELEMLRIASERVVELDARGDRQPRPRPHQGGTDRSAAARGNDPRPDLRILPDHRRHQPQPRAVAARPGGRAKSSRSIPAATITAISAICAAWPFRASRTPSSRTCWRRSRRSSAPR